MIDTNSPFARHVAEGLTAEQAFLSSRFIYDERGSKLFQQIMGLDEYYLTRAETEILTTQAGELHRLFSKSGAYELVELGAGDGAKTKLLLSAALAAKGEIVYRPVDISPDILKELAQSLRDNMPALQVDPIAASYDEALERLAQPSDVRRVILFLGSNIGNFSLVQATAFCRKIASSLKPGDLFLLGADLRKDPRKILQAYDDASGVTAAFNLNLLHRANRELGANFDVDSWGFYPLYNPESGEVRSYLYPQREQHITLPSLNIERTFNVGEVIHTEVSRKYTLAELAQMASECGCRVVAQHQDEAKNFVDVVWQKLA